MPGLRFPANALIPYFVGDVSGSITPDMALGSLFIYILTGNVTINSPINQVGPGNELILIVQQDGTGGWTITWDSEFGNSPGNPMAGSNLYTTFRFVNLTPTPPNWWCVSVR